MSGQIYIIGAGAAGLMAAVTAARQGAAVTILEANDRPGKKLLASGNGKCNFTNRNLRLSDYNDQSRKLSGDVIRAFDQNAADRFFRELGVLSVDRNGWVYPRTDQSSSILKALLMEAEHLGVRIKTREKVCRIVRGKSGSGFQIRTEGWTYEAETVILACGSPASSVTGSSDDISRFMKELGIGMHPFLPALVPLKIRENYGNRWSGVRTDAALRMQVEGEPDRIERGNLQLTEYGISGIPVFQLSRYAVPAIREQHRKVVMRIDFLPECSREELAVILKKIRTDAPWKTPKQQLSGLLPERLIPVISAETPEKTVSRIKDFSVTIRDAASMHHAQICCGGVRAEELTEQLACRKYPGLYCVGEAVDVDGPCGGYNLQWAWSSGHTAGLAAAQT